MVLLQAVLFPRYVLNFIYNLRSFQTSTYSLVSHGHSVRNWRLNTSHTTGQVSTKHFPFSPIPSPTPTLHIRHLNHISNNTKWLFNLATKMRSFGKQGALHNYKSTSTFISYFPPKYILKNPHTTKKKFQISLEIRTPLVLRPLVLSPFALTPPSQCIPSNSRPLIFLRVLLR